MILNVNGVFTDPRATVLPADDGGLLFGDTLFETIKARGKRLLFLREHLDRLALSAGLLAFPFDRRRVEEALAAVAGRLEAPVSRVRLTLSRGPAAGLAPPPPEAAWFAVAAAPYAEPDAAQRQAGAACVLAPNRRVNPLSHLPQMKRGNYADCLYAARHALARGAREALFVTDDGWVLEGATSNLFLVREGVLVTPPAGELVLAGIMRGRVLEAARAAGLEVREQETTLAELCAADEAFLTNSLIDLLPIASVAGRPLSRGKTAGRLLALVQDLAGVHPQASDGR